jgi:hypothetical protein
LLTRFGGKPAFAARKQKLMSSIVATLRIAVLAADRAAQWRDVNLGADPSLPNLSWPRLAAAQGWLDEHKTTGDASLDAFRVSAKSAADASGGPKAEDSDRLYDDLTRWRSLMQ